MSANQPGFRGEGPEGGSRGCAESEGRTLLLRVCQTLWGPGWHTLGKRPLGEALGMDVGTRQRVGWEGGSFARLQGWGWAQGGETA